MKFKISNELSDYGYLLFEDENGNKSDVKEFDIMIDGDMKTIVLEALPNGWINSYMISSIYDLKSSCECHPLREKTTPITKDREC